MRKSFIFYSSYYEAISKLPEKEQGALYKAIIDYVMEQKEPNFSGVAEIIFTLIKPNLDSSNKQYENGSKGGRPKTQTEPNDIPDEELEETQTKPKPNPNSNPDKTQLKPKRNPSNNPNETQTEPRANPTHQELELELEQELDINKNNNKGEIITTAHTRETPLNIEAFERFKKKHPKIMIDTPRIDSIDFDSLSEKIGESEFLKQQTLMSFFAKNYFRVIADGYKDFAPNKKGRPDKSAKFEGLDFKEDIL